MFRVFVLSFFVDQLGFGKQKHGVLVDGLLWGVLEVLVSSWRASWFIRFVFIVSGVIWLML